MKKLQKVTVAQDISSHWYVVPTEKIKEFYKDEEKGEETDDWDEFEKKWGMYRTGGDINNIQLYAEL